VRSVERMEERMKIKRSGKTMANRRASNGGRGAAVKRRATGPSMDAITLLKKDHVEARKLLKQLSESRESAGERRRATLTKVAAALWVHMEIEESIFYPAFEVAGKTSDDEVRGIEAREEHGAAKTALRKLERCDPSTTEFRAMAKIVYDLIDHHAEEEEGEMFPRAKKLLGKERLAELGQTLASAKKQLMDGAERSWMSREEPRASRGARMH
jgi:hemerythrin-like domain-containing protein